MLPSDYEISENLSHQYLYDLLSCFSVQDSPYFDGVPVTNQEAADLWFEAMWNYFTCLSSPPLIKEDLHKDSGSLVKSQENALRLMFRTKFSTMNLMLTGNMDMFASCFTEFTRVIYTLFSAFYTTVPTIPILSFMEVEILGKRNADGSTCIWKLSELVHEYVTHLTSTMIEEPHTVFVWS